MAVARSTDVLLSVVIPTHNVRPWIRQTLDSVLRQRVASMEVIVVDDHSGDGTDEAVRARALEDPRLRIISSTVRGGGSARNIGIRASRGNYIAFCDGDDLVPDGAYAALVASLERTGSELALGDYLKFRSVDTWRPTQTMSAFDFAVERTSLRDTPGLLLSRPCWNKVFRRDFLIEHRIEFPDVPRSNDIVPMVRAYALARAIDVIEDVVYVYRERPGGSSMTARASGAESVLSYLGQEIECARIVRSLNARRLDRQLADLIWNRDGFHHVEQYVLAWNDSPASATICQSVRLLIDLAGDPPSDCETRRVLVLQLVAAGHTVVARAAARVLAAPDDTPGGDVMTVQRLDDWLDLLQWADVSGALSSGARADLVERVSRQLQWELDPSAAVKWRKLVVTANRVLGSRGSMYSPAALQPAHQDHMALATRTEVRARMTALRGGSAVVRMTGSADVPEGVMRPVLFDGLAAGRVIRPVTVHLTRSGSREHWDARFAIASLPLHRPLTPAVELLEPAHVVPVQYLGAMPVYSARDGLLYDRIDGVTVIRRRRHWAIRGMRRLAGSVIGLLRRDSPSAALNR